MAHIAGADPVLINPKAVGEENLRSSGEALSEDNLPPSVVIQTSTMDDAEREAQSDDHSADVVPQSVTEESRQLTTLDDLENHIWDNVVHLTKDDPKMLWQIWDVHVAPVLGFPGGIATFKQWTTTYNWDRGHELLRRLADCLCVRYNEVSLLAASESSYIDEKLVFAAIGYIRSYTTQTIHSYIEILLRMVSNRAQLVD